MPQQEQQMHKDQQRVDVRYREADDSTGKTGQGWLRFVVSLKVSSGNEVSNRE